MTDLVTRLRALADEHKHPLVAWEQRLVATLREAADALEAEETRRMMLNTSNGEWSKRFHALEQERDALKAELAEVTGKLIDQDLAGIKFREEPNRGSWMERAEKAEAALAEMEAQRGRDNAHDIDEARAEAAALREVLAKWEAPTGGLAFLTRLDRVEKAEAEVARLTLLWKDSERYLVGPEHVAAAERADNAQKALEEMNGAWLEARAEAAAMREVATNLLKYIKGVQGGDWSDSEKALSQPGPGAALLERVKKLEAVAEHVRGMRKAHDEYKAYCTNDLFKALAALEEKP